MAAVITRQQAVDWLLAQVGKTGLGTNPSDLGQCLGFISLFMQQITGEGGYAIQGAYGAADMLTATNTRPDIFTQITNDPNNPNQIPSVGDIPIYKKSASNGNLGHIGAAIAVTDSGTTNVEQNWIPNTVTQQTHAYGNVIGWIHVNYKEEEPMTNAGDVVNVYRSELGRDPEAQSVIDSQTGIPFSQLYYGVKDSPEGQIYRQKIDTAFTEAAKVPALEKQVADLTEQVEQLTEDLNSRPTQEQFDSLKAELTKLQNYRPTLGEIFKMLIDRIFK